jgi:hypothetical protein
MDDGPKAKPPLLPPGTWRRAMVGVVASLPAWGRALQDSRPARVSRQAVASLARTPPGRRIRRLLARARGRVLLRIAELAAAGAEEERRGRERAKAAFDQTFDMTCSRLAESTVIQDLVRQQSAGLASSAIARLRAWSAAADDAVENLVARLLFPRRHRRQPRRHLLPVETAP